jgi:heme/copper-type cytochrome/quinol oxidase subunit 1
MPSLSVRLLRLSLASLLVGSLIGAWLLAAEPWPSIHLAALRTAHLQLMLFGWLVPFVIGTAYWMLPRHPGGGRGPLGLARLGYGLMLLGVVLGTSGPLAGLASVHLGGIGCSCLGTGLFIGLLWSRVRAFGVPPGGDRGAT